MPSYPTKLHFRVRLPVNIKPQDMASFIGQWNYEVPQPCIKNLGAIHYSSTTLMLKKGKIVPESFGSVLETKPQWQSIRDYQKPLTYARILAREYLYYKHQQHLQSAFVFSDHVGRGYYEWLFDCLPRLIYGMQQNVTAVALVPYSGSLTYICEILHLLGVDYVQAQRHKYISVSQLQLSARQAPYNHSNPITVCDTREHLLKIIFPKGRPNPHRKIYVSRQKAWVRKLVCEELVVALLQSRGFETIYAEDLSMQEKICIFAQASCVIGPHGGGLANMLFMQPGTTIMEIGNRASLPIVYCDHASALGLNYYYYFADKIFENPDALTKNWDIGVNIEGFERELDSMLAHLS